MKYQYLQLAITCLTASVYGAPTVFVLHPLVLNNEPQLGTLQRGAGLVVTLDGQHLFLVAPQSSLESQGRKATEEQYDVSYNEGQDGKDQHDTEEGNADDSQISYEDTTTENRGLEESDDYVQEREDVSQKHENPQEGGNESGSSEEEDGKGTSTEGSYNENTESPKEPESTDDK